MKNKKYKCQEVETEFIEMEFVMIKVPLSQRCLRIQIDSEVDAVLLSEEQALDLANEIINYYKKQNNATTTN